MTTIVFSIVTVLNFALLHEFVDTSYEDCNYDKSVSSIQNQQKQCVEIYKLDQKSYYRPNPLTEPDICLEYIPLSSQMSALEQVLVGLPFQGRCDYSIGNCFLPHLPYDASLRRGGDDWAPYGYTMIGYDRMENFRAAIQEVNAKQIPGDIVELGVWRGGAMMFATAIQREYEQNAQIAKENNVIMKRQMYLYDAFGDFISTDLNYGKHQEFLRASLDFVKNGFKMFGLYDESKVHFVKGLFHETTPSWDVAKSIAVLRIDGNLDYSYEEVMYNLYESVSVGGIVIWDDIFHPTYKPVLNFWYKFKKDHGLVEEFVPIDKISGWFRKKNSVTLDHTKKSNKKF